MIIKQNFAFHGMSIVGMIDRHDLFKFMSTSVRIDTHVDSKSSYPDSSLKDHKGRSTSHQEGIRQNLIIWWWEAWGSLIQ